MADIFISYAREDRERARTIASGLQVRGWSVWWDRDVIAGQAFDQVIEHELETAKSVVVLWSADSIASDWVKSEAAVAVRRGVLVPALIDNIKLPLEFSRRQTADLIDWEGDTSHEGFQALCNALTATVGMKSRSTLDASDNRHAARDSSYRRRVSKRWWQTLPGILVASTALLAALAAILAALNRGLMPTHQLSQSAPTSASPTAQRGQPTNSAPTLVPSTDRDTPTRLTSNEIVGRGLGERISYYYVFNAGPGNVSATVDGKNRPVGLANAIRIELFDVNAKRLLSISLGNTTDDKRVVRRVQLGRQQQVIMRVLLDAATIDYKVRLEGAVDFTTPPR
jgi:hypothetical protein